MIRKKSGRLFFHTLRNVITCFIVMCVLLLAILLIGVRLIGYTPYAILSESMTPAYKVGDLVYVKQAKTENIQPGDVVTFVADENLTVVTHRLVENNPQNESMITKGDANDSVDVNPVLYENVIGVVVFSISKLGYISYYIGSSSGKYMIFAVICGILFFCFCLNWLKLEANRISMETALHNNF